MLLKPDSEKITVRLLTGYWPFFWLTIMIFALYFRSLFFQYTFFDDHELIKYRIDFFQRLSNFWQIFKQDAFNNYGSKFYYRPMLTATFFIDGWIGGGKLWLFHLSNIIYHLLACWLVFIFLKNLTRTQLTSFLFTAIFAVHPVITQVVVWIPGRNDSLLTIFLLLSFLTFLRYLDSKGIIYAFFSLIAFFMALLIKELAVFFPVVIILYVFIFRKEKKKKLIMLSMAWILLILIMSLIRSEVLGKSLGATNISEMIKSIWLNIPAIPAYIGKVFIPYGLSVYPNLKDMNVPVVLGYIFIVLMLSTFLFNQADRKLMLFGFLWFLIFLIPGFIKAVNMSEHRIYFPMIGILIFMAGVIRELKIKWVPLFIVIWIVLISINIIYSSSFKDRLTLWQQAVNSSPSSAFNSNNLGAMYYLKNDLTNAEKYFRKAVQLNHTEPLANGNLGLVLMNTNRLNEAEIYLLQENKVNPNYDNAYFNLGILYMKMGNTQLALDYMLKTISVNPGYVDAYQNLLNYYQQTNQPQFLQSVIDLAQKNGVKFN